MGYHFDLRFLSDESRNSFIVDNRSKTGTRIVFHCYILTTSLCVLFWFDLYNTGHSTRLTERLHVTIAASILKECVT